MGETGKHNENSLLHERVSQPCFSLFAVSQKTQSFKASLSNSQLIPLKNTVSILHYATDAAAANSLGG